MADQPHQQHEPRGRVHQRAGLGLAMGPVGSAAGHPGDDGREGRVRPGGRPEGRGGTAGGLSCDVYPFKAPRAIPNRRLCHDSLNELN